MLYDLRKAQQNCNPKRPSGFSILPSLSLHSLEPHTPTKMKTIAIVALCAIAAVAVAKKKGPKITNKVRIQSHAPRVPMKIAREKKPRVAAGAP